MSETLEQISSIVDGECGKLTSAQIKEISNNSENFETWTRYNLMKSLLKDEVQGEISDSFMKGFAEKFASEPIVMAPKRKQTAEVEVSSDKESVRFVSRKNFARWMKFAGQAAIAASVLLVAVVGVHTFSSNYGAEDSSVINTTPYGGYASPVSAHFDANSRLLQNDKLSKDGNVEPSFADNSYMAENELREVESLLNDHFYQINISSVRR